MRDGKVLGLVLWIVATAIMLLAARHQRTTGPTYPLDLAIEIENLEGELVLPRSGTTDAPATIEWPGRVVVSDLWVEWRRYPTNDAFERLEFRSDGTGPWMAELPVQPAAGKIEYRVVAESLSGPLRTFPENADPPILRYKDPVPLGVLIPHIAFMFLSMLMGVRCALAAAFGRNETRWLVPVTAIGLTIGGMILGPIVQKFAFGAYWTGWPFGEDLTDNKTLFMWFGWVVLAIVFTLRSSWRRSDAGRIATLLVALVMLTVYMIPHSLRGSQLDYEALDEGTEAHEAIRTGDR